MIKVACVMMVAFLITACKVNESVSNINRLEIVPLAVGNTWHFSGSNKTEVAEILSSKNINGREWYEFKEIDNDSIFWVSNSDNGQLEINFPVNSNYELVLKYPVEGEEIYKAFDQYTKVTPNVIVDVPAGVFKTYKYQYSIKDDKNIFITWYAPGIGPVKYKTNDEILVLTSYEIN